MQNNKDSMINKREALTLYNFAIDACDPRIEDDEHLALLEQMTNIDVSSTVVILGSLLQSTVGQIVRMIDDSEREQFLNNFLKNLRISLSEAPLDFLADE